uniref:Cry1-1 n=1 Tax=Rhizophora mucronata TaxID=61149 RepID=A0A2P2MCY0_RHIMU
MNHQNQDLLCWMKSGLDHTLIIQGVITLFERAASNLLSGEIVDVSASKNLCQFYCHHQNTAQGSLKLEETKLELCLHPFLFCCYLKILLWSLQNLLDLS